MSDVPLSQNQEALDELCRLLRFSQGEFSLTLAVCNSTRHQQQLIGELRQRCLVNFVEITLAATATTLFSTINAYVSNTAPKALMVYGLNEVHDSEQLLAATNQIREEFRKFAFPLVLWLTDRDLKHVIRTAPDFYTWANSVVFETPSSFFLAFIDRFVEDVWQQVTQSQEHRFLSLRDLGCTTTSSSYQELETSLTVLDRRHISLSPWQIADLEFVRGRIANNNSVTARQYYESSLKQWGKIIAGDDNLSQWQERMGHVQFYLGLWWRTYGERHRPSFEMALGKARQYFLAAISTFETAQHADLVAKYINYLAETLHRLEHWSELETVATKARQLHQNNAFRVARTEGFLAEVALAKEDWLAAQRYAESALSLIEPNNLSDRLKQDTDFYNWVDSFHRSWYLFSLGKAQFQQNDIDQAVATLEQARSVAYPDYDPKLYSAVLEQLQKGYFQQGLYLPAFETHRQKDAIESRFNYRAFVGAGRLQPKQQITNPALPSAGIFKDVIVASGRKKHARELVRRLAQDEYVLTIIYGPSGVGKSSLIEAGLVPALEQERIETRRVMPVYLRRYRQWEEDLVQTLKAIDTGESVYDSGIFSDLRNHPTMAVDTAATIRTSPDKVLRRLKHHTQKNQIIVLVFDQFEEFFFEFEKTSDRRPFYQFFQACLSMPFVKVLLSLREDYIHYLLECDRITQLNIIDNNILDKKWLYYVGNFTPEETQAVFKDLTDPTPYSPEDALIDQVVQDLAAGAGEVRPIELQIVGAQLQKENITTKQEYHSWRDPSQPTKELLVQEYLNDVLCACGPIRNQQLADLTLYLLTSEQGLRPLKTKSDLVDDLRGLSAQQDLEQDIIHLILKILTQSGLVMEVPEFPEERYQLVHDYLASFMREQKQSLKIEKLLSNLAQEKQARATIENKFSRFLQALGLAASFGFIVVSVLLYETRSLTQRAQENKAERLLETAQTFHQADKSQLIEPLLNTVEAAEQFQRQDWNKVALRARISLELQNSLSKIREINRFGGHSKSVLDVSYSHDGTLIASAGDDGIINIRDRSGRLQNRISAHQDSIRSIAFSPDNTVIASASHDQTIKLWSLDGTLLKTLTGHTNKVNSVVFSPDGKRLASASADRTIKVWSVDTGAAVRTISGHDSWVNSVAFSNDGQQLVSSGSDNTIRLWSPDGQVLGAIAQHDAAVNQVVFSPDDQLLASASTDRTVKLWTREGQLLQTLDAHQDKVWDVSFSPNGQFLVSASSDRTLKLWNLQGTLLDNYRASDSQATFFSVSFSPDETKFGSASADERVSLWNLKVQDSTLISHTEEEPTSLASANGNGAFISGYQNGTLKFWDDSKRLRRTVQGHTEAITDVSTSLRGDMIASAGNDGTIKLWQNNGSLLRELEGHEHSVTSVRFNPKDDSIVSADSQGSIKRWNIEGELIDSFDNNRPVTRISTNKKLLAVGHTSGTITLWNWEGRQLQSLSQHQHPISGLEFSPGGDEITSTDTNGRVIVWSVRSGNSLHIKDYLGQLTDLAYSESRELIAIASTEGKVHFWHIPTETTLATLNLHRSGSRILLDFDPDNPSFLSLGSDGRLHTWNLNIDELLQSSCSWLKDFLGNDENSGQQKRSSCLSYLQ